MSHNVEGFIATTDMLEAGTKHLRHAKIVALAQGLSLLPVTEELTNEVGGFPESSEGEESPTFYSLTPALAKLGMALSARGPVAYIETDYWGDGGEQAAVVWKEGEVYREPERSRYFGPINGALLYLDVEQGAHADRFEAIGLHRFRSNDDWINQRT